MAGIGDIVAKIFKTVGEGFLDEIGSTIAEKVIALITGQSENQEILDAIDKLAEGQKVILNKLDEVKDQADYNALAAIASEAKTRFKTSLQLFHTHAKSAANGDPEPLKQWAADETKPDGLLWYMNKLDEVMQQNTHTDQNRSLVFELMVLRINEAARQCIEQDSDDGTYTFYHIAQEAKQMFGDMVQAQNTGLILLACAFIIRGEKDGGIIKATSDNFQAQLEYTNKNTPELLRIFGQVTEPLTIPAMRFDGGTHDLRYKTRVSEFNKFMPVFDPSAWPKHDAVIWIWQRKTGAQNSAFKLLPDTAPGHFRIQGPSGSTTRPITQMWHKGIGHSWVLTNMGNPENPNQSWRITPSSNHECVVIRNGAHGPWAVTKHKYPWQYYATEAEGYAEALFHDFTHVVGLDDDPTDRDEVQIELTFDEDEIAKISPLFP